MLRHHKLRTIPQSKTQLQHLYFTNKETKAEMLRKLIKVSQEGRSLCSKSSFSGYTLQKNILDRAENKDGLVPCALWKKACARSSRVRAVFRSEDTLCPSLVPPLLPVRSRFGWAPDFL